jgi:hypothetical protein
LTNRRWPWLAPGEPDPPDPGDHRPARTFRGASIAMVLILAALAVVAYGCMGGQEEPALERYARLGPVAGAEALRRDLLAAHPPGSALAPLLDRLSRLGFDCTAAVVDPARPGECVLRALRPNRRVLRMAVAPEHDGVLVRGISARMAVEPLP